MSTVSGEKEGQSLRLQNRSRSKGHCDELNFHNCVNGGGCESALNSTTETPVVLVMQIRVTGKGCRLPLSNLTYTKGLIIAKCLKRRKKSTNDVHHTGKTRHTRSKREGEINIAHPPPARDLSKERHAYCQGPPRHLELIRGRSGALRVLVLLSSVVLRFCDVRFWTRHRKGGLFLFFFEGPVQQRVWAVLVLYCLVDFLVPASSS